MLRRAAPVALCIAAAFATFFAARGDWPAVTATLASAGWMLLPVIALHIPQTFASAWSWRALIRPAAPTPARSYLLRWIRDSVNTLLPVGQVGGDVIRIRLSAREGRLTLAAAAGATIADISLEVVAQVAFTVFAVAVLLAQKGVAGDAATVVAVSALAVSAGIMLALVAARRSDMFGWLEGFAVRRLWPGANSLIGANAAMTSLHAHPRRLAASFVGHLAAWGLGAVETYAALRVIGMDRGIGAALVIEALGHAARAVGFFIPGSLGVQEGGYVLVCALYGIGAPAALSLSAIKRIRELALGVPGLLLWGWDERRGVGAAPSTVDDRDFI